MDREGKDVMIVVGIDPGVATGFAEWCLTRRHLVAVTSMQIHDAMARVAHLHGEGVLHHVVFEDARLRTGYFGKNADQKRQGAGSVKRDCSIWADYLGSLGIAYRSVSPKAKGKKVGAVDFRAAYGWQPATNEHGRDAAALIIGARAEPPTGIQK